MNTIVHLTRSFTQDPAEGNPAGIVLDADHLTDEQMLAITQQLSFPESGFVQESEKANFRLRIFSVRGEVPACVTVTLAAASLLGRDQVIFETQTGLREILCEPDGLLLMQRPEAIHGEAEVDRKRIADLLGTKDIAPFPPIEPVDTGSPKLIIPMKSLKRLNTLQPNLPGITEYSRETGTRGFYPFTLVKKKGHTEVHARAFNPYAGINEDPATGVAAGALQAYLEKYHLLTRDRLVIQQGHAMGSPSELLVIKKDEDIFVGGYVVQTGKTSFST